MRYIKGYKIIRQIENNRRAEVYEVCREDADEAATCILTLLKISSHSLSKTARFRQELESIISVETTGIIRILDLFEYKNGFSVVTEDFDGRPLSELIQESPLDLLSFLKIGILVAESLGHLHRNKLYHGNIKPQSILFRESDVSIRIRNFGVAALLAGDLDEIYHSDTIRDILPYISPEQTGRMNRTTDYRTDLYSLGITFYELLTGQLPFKSTDPMELLYAHIAQQPLAPEEVKSDIPAVISELTLKLLSKTAEDRYQNAFGLASDLKSCLSQLQESGYIRRFKLGRADRPVGFNIPQKLYGRDAEIQMLLEEFRAVVEGGNRIVLITGKPGIGRSALVNEIQTAIATLRGYFIKGKYEQFRRDVPYSAIIQSLKSLIRQILTESEGRIAEWRNRILDAVGSNGRIITDIIPDLELIIGPQPEIADLGAEEAHNRFGFVFEQFIRAFPEADHPIVLFLDDLQWADEASLGFMKQVIHSEQIPYLNTIGAYRDDRLADVRPLNELLDDIQADSVHINMIHLQDLPREEVSRLVVDLLKCSEEEGVELGNLVYKKTGGNPFFIIQFLRNLFEEKYIQQKRDGVWEWDTQKIVKLQVTDNLVDLMVEKINKLSPETREMLKTCSCIGNRFDLEVVAELLDRKLDDVMRCVSEARDEGLVDCAEDTYFFQHDRIQEAANLLIPDEERHYLHYRIGNLAFEKVDDADISKKLFYIVDQLNAGAACIKNDSEKNRLVALNADAGKKANDSAAFSTALAYFKTGLDLLDENAWDNNYDLTLDLYAHAIESAYFTGNSELMENLAKKAVGRSKTAQDRVVIQSILIQAYTSQKDYGAAIKTGLETLASIGIKVPENPENEQVAGELFKLLGILQDKTDDDILALPEMTDPDMIAAVQIMTAMGDAAYLRTGELLRFLIPFQTNIHFEFGLHPNAASAFVSFGVFQIVGLVDLKGGYRFGNLAFKILDRYNDRRLLSSVINTYNLMIRHWIEHPKNCLAKGIEAYRMGIETGNPQSAATGLFLHDTYQLGIGENLDGTEKSMAKHNPIIKKLNQEHIFNYHSMLWQFALNLMGRCEDPTRLIGKAYNEEEMEPLLYEREDHIALCNLYYTKSLLNCFLDDYETAFEFIEKAEQYKHLVRGLIHSTSINFYGTLIRQSLYLKASEEVRKQFRIVIDENIEQLKKWADVSPVVFLHKYLAIKAQEAYLSGDVPEAMALFDRAIETSQERGFLSETGLFSRMAGQFYFDIGRTKIAEHYITDAYRWHLILGDHVAAEAIQKRFSALGTFNFSPSQTAEASPDAASAHEKLDISTIIKVSQALSGEIVLSELLEKMMRITVENAGAEKGFLVFRENSDLIVEAEASVQDDSIQTLQSIPVNDHPGVSTAIVNYVARTQQTLILNNAVEEGMFTQDEYVRANQPKSILCLAIINQGRFAGLLYLENNLSISAFTHERLEMTKIIASQAAVSIENARLYANLEQKVTERTAELEKAYQEIKTLALTDPLTQLSNRRDIMDKIESEIKRFNRSRQSFTIVLCDIDNFKSVNDTYGHDFGDEVLVTVSQVMKANIREQDMLARWGGEEFLFVLPETEAEGAGTTANKVRQAIQDTPVTFNDQTITVSMTFGVSCFREWEPSIESCLKKADEALYRGKESGKNCVILAD